MADALAKDSQSQYAPLKKSLTTEQYIELRDLKLAYLHMQGRETRVYPNGAVAGNILGFLDGSGTAQAGIEQLGEECLAPIDGEESYRRGANGVVIPGSERTVDAVDGGSVQLTINSDLQWYLQQMVGEEARKQGAKGGTVTVVEAKTGKIRAAAEWPSLDPNDLDSSTPETRYSQIFHRDFEPGSTFKAITAAAVIEGRRAHAPEHGHRIVTGDVPQRRRDQRRVSTTRRTTTPSPAGSSTPRTWRCPSSAPW